MQKQAMKWLPILLTILLLFLQYRLWCESGGIVDMMRLKKISVQEAKLNEKLKERNQKLSQQVQNLQKNNKAIETRARQELGMIKKDETFYQVVTQ